MHARHFRGFLLRTILFFVFGPFVFAAEHQIRVAAGDVDRANSIVTFGLPRGFGSDGLLEDSEGRRISLQVDAVGEASFILKQLTKGQERTYRLLRGKLSNDPRESVQVNQTGAKIKVFNHERPVFEYHAGPGELPRPDIRPIFRRGGYIHPLLSPSGKLVTDDYAPNHIHQHGIWFAWTKTEFDGRQPDFWNMGQGKGRVDFVALDRFWSGPVHGGFQARHRYVDLTGPEPVSVLNESWDVRVYNVQKGARPYWTFDLVATQECAGNKPLVLPKYHYGGLGVRGNWEWNGKDKTFFLTSAGESDRVKGNETRGRWCHLFGEVEGGITGVTILCHPRNYQAPQPMRLHPSEPFFCYAPSQAGDWQITPEKPYVSRYRFVVFDGPPNAVELDRLWNDYANPVKVVVSGS